MKTVLPIILTSLLLAWPASGASLPYAAKLTPEVACTPPLRCNIFKNELQTDFLTGQRCEPILSTLLPEELNLGQEFDSGFKLLCDANELQQLGSNNES